MPCKGGRLGLISTILFIITCVSIYMLGLHKVFYMLTATWCFTLKLILEFIFNKTMSFQPFRNIIFTARAENKETRLSIVLLFLMLAMVMSWLAYDGI